MCPKWSWMEQSRLKKIVPLDGVDGRCNRKNLYKKIRFNKFHESKLTQIPLIGCGVGHQIHAESEATNGKQNAHPNFQWKWVEKGENVGLIVLRDSENDGNAQWKKWFCKIHHFGTSKICTKNIFFKFKIYVNGATAMSASLRRISPIIPSQVPFPLLLPYLLSRTTWIV